jgi:hypothetical protein
MSEARKRDAYLEAQQILRLDKKWQHLMPGERKPNFKRVAREIIRRALGHKVTRNQPQLNLHSGLMHEHEPREAALIERTLKNGMHDPRLLHSFQLGSKNNREAGSRLRPKVYDTPYDPELPDFEVFVHDHSETIDYPSHFEPGTGLYHSSVHNPPEHAEVPVHTGQARLPSQYEAVH